MSQPNEGRNLAPPFPLGFGVQFLFCALLTLTVFAAYVLVPMWRTGRLFVLPLDDVYIHFQYAKQIANGQPYVYNPGLPPSSGATSLLYPYLLAIGYGAGFQGMALGWWALILAWAAWTGCCWLLLQIAHRARLPAWAALAFVIVFAATGSISWHFLSGMETGLLTFFMLLTLYAMLTKRFVLGVAAAVLMAVTRPEGAIMAMIAVPMMLWTYWRQVPRWQLIWVSSPVLSLGIQPLVNRIFTGDAQAAGSSAKSILSMVPADYTVIATRIFSNFGRIWWEFFTGYSQREGLYLPIGLLLFALIGVWVLFQRTKRWNLALMVLGWLGAGTLAVATLDPAFWHFKRYQVPFMVLLYPLAAWGLGILSEQRWFGRVGTLIVLMLFGGSAFISGVTFWRSYQINVEYLLGQQIPMADWLRENTPENAVIAVHDVGIMRYVGERTTVDMVGLTTPHAADSWRNGPGAVAAFLTSYSPRPGYVASYTDALGLSYLADTGLYDELLVEFPVDLSDRYNVALAGAYQGIWEIDWSNHTADDMPRQPYPLTQINGLRLVDKVDVANLQSEAEHAYSWSNRERIPGFPTEVYEFDYAACDENCTVLDGGRRINGMEMFTLDTEPEQDLLLVTRVHSANAGTFDVYVNDTQVATRTLPVVAGQWLDIVTFVDEQGLTDQTAIRIEPHTPGGHYMPYYHWSYQGSFNSQPAPANPSATFGDVLVVEDIFIDIVDGRLTVEASVAASTALASANYRSFVHVYDDITAPPVAQVDRYPLDGATPPGNWLIGEVSDAFVVDLSNLPSGTYTVAIGYYDPESGERLSPQSTQYNVLDGRLMLGDIEIN